MRNLFGASLDTIALALLGIFAIIAVIIVVLACKDRIMFKIGARYIPRRPLQTALIILGLMLSTVIITTAFGTGDTMVSTIRSLAIRSLGETDVVVLSMEREEALGDLPIQEGLGRAGDSPFFGEQVVQEVRQALEEVEEVNGVVPAILGSAPALHEAVSGISVQTLVYAPDPAYLGYRSDTLLIRDTEGRVLDLEDLAEDEVYLDEASAERLAAGPGDEITLYFGEVPLRFQVRDIAAEVSAGRVNLAIMPLDRAQRLFEAEGQINTINISNIGGTIGGADYTTAVEEALAPVLEGSEVIAEPVKQDAIEEADLAGSVFTTMFVAFGLFSIAAGLLLIFLVYSLLAAARKSEMGMARAIGTKRRHLVEIYLFEGTLYDLAAAMVGVGLGMLITFAIAGVLASAFADTPIDPSYHFESRNLFIAFAMGMILTFATVGISAWRVSRLNIVRAVRDIPEPKYERVGRRWLLFSLAVVLLGVWSLLGGLAGDEAFIFYLGASLLIIGGALLLRWFGLNERLTFTVAGAALLAWWLIPPNQLAITADFQIGIEMFFLAGIMMVLGAVWVVTYNLDILLGGLTAIVGWLKSVVPALRMAIAYPMKRRLRTGLTLAMFSLVVFTVAFMAVVVEANVRLFSEWQRFSGGYDVQGTFTPGSVPPDVAQLIAASPELDQDEISNMPGVSATMVQVAQPGAAGSEPADYLLWGVDETYMDSTAFGFDVMAEGYESERELWQALAEQPGAAFITADAVPTEREFRYEVGGPEFRLEGVLRSDEVMEPQEISIIDPATGFMAELTVIAVIEATNFQYGVYTSQATLEQVWPRAMQPYIYLFDLAEGVEAEDFADRLEIAFLPFGLQSLAIERLVRDVTETAFTLTSLLQGFVSLGLLVGIAALGVMSTRAVVERRHEIGVLRAIGYRRRTIYLSFLLESAVIALLGIAIGIVLALPLSYNVINFLEFGVAGLGFFIPWQDLLILAGVAFVASLVMTYFPARQASLIAPAEALRYE